MFSGSSRRDPEGRQLPHLFFNGEHALWDDLVPSGHNTVHRTGPSILHRQNHASMTSLWSLDTYCDNATIRTEDNTDGLNSDGTAMYPAVEPDMRSM